MKCTFLALLLSFCFNLYAEAYKYGELFFVEKAKHEHSKLYVLGTTITDSNLIDSYGLALNYSLYQLPLLRLSAEGTFRATRVTRSAEIITQNSSVEQQINKPGTSVHFVTSLLILKAKSSLFNKFYQDLQLYVDLGLGMTQYSKHTFRTASPLSLYGGVTLEIPFDRFSILAKYRRISDNFNEEDKSNYNELLLGAGFKW